MPEAATGRFGQVHTGGEVEKILVVGEAVLFGPERFEIIRTELVGEPRIPAGAFIEHRRVGGVPRISGHIGRFGQIRNRFAGNNLRIGEFEVRIREIVACLKPQPEIELVLCVDFEPEQMALVIRIDRPADDHFGRGAVHDQRQRRDIGAEAGAELFGIKRDRQRSGRRCIPFERNIRVPRFQRLQERVARGADDAANIAQIRLGIETEAC